MYTGLKSDTDMALLGGIAVGRGAISDVATDTAGGSVLVTANYGDNSVSLFDADAGMAHTTVDVGGEPVGAVVADNRVYVATTASDFDSVVVVDADTASAIAICPVQSGISGIAVSPDRKRVYVSRTGHDVADVVVMDTTTEEVSKIGLATGPGVIAEALRVSPDGQRLYAAICDGRGDRLIAIDTEAKTVHAALRIGSPIRDIAVSPDGALAYVLAANPRRGGVVITVDTATNTIAETLEIGGWPTHMALSPEGTRAFIANRDHVTVVCTVNNEIIDSIIVGAQPSAVATSPDGARLYVADYDGNLTALSVAPGVTVPGMPAAAMGVLALPKLRELQAAAV
jgi:DNA-binding beta-propeller fold protein YncE